MEFESKLIRQDRVIVGEYPGWKTEFMISLCPEGQCIEYAYESNFMTIANGKVYSFEFEEKPLKVPESLPIVNKMMDSLRINPIKQSNMSRNMSLQETRRLPKTNDAEK
mgnify:CR=1 FL=1